MADAGSTMAEDVAAMALYRERAPEVTLARDAWRGWRNAFARLAALLLHAALLIFLIGGPAAERLPVAAEPIPVELVIQPPLKKAEAPSKPKPQPRPPQPQPQPQPSAQSEPAPVHLESGGSPELEPGRLPNAAAQKPVNQPTEVPRSEVPTPPTTEPPRPVQPPQQAQPAVKPPAPATAKEDAAAKAVRAEAPAGAQPSSVTDRPAADKSGPQLAAIPRSAAKPNTRPGEPTAAAPGELSAPELSESERRGAGGGDSYLNALRDAIIGKLIYPSAAKGMVGVAKYAIEMNRQGYMLRVNVVQSTGSPALDRAGMDAIQNVMPFQPLPLRILGDHVLIMATLYIGPQS
ncbi:MAG: TonB family protein [Alphaproteobacteria bacterium]